MSCSNCGALLVDYHQPVAVPAGFEPAAADDQGTADGGVLDLGSSTTWDPSPQTAREPALRRLAPFSRWIIAGLVVLSGFIANFLSDAKRDDGGAIVDQGAVDVTEARVGDCLDLRDEDFDSDVIEEFVGVPCSTSHQMEVYALLTYPDGGAYPGDAALESYSVERCTAEFGSYMGAPYDTEPILDFNYFTPTEDGWNDGDRGVTCAVIAYDGSELVGSMRGLGMIHYGALSAGCYDLPEGSESGLYGMHPRTCGQEHDVEVYAAVVEPSGPDAAFVDADLVEFADAACLSGYEALPGGVTGDPDVTWSYYYPSEGSWADGDRSITCYLQRIDQQPLVGSHAGSA